MAPGSANHTLDIDDPALTGGEWLFKRDGQVFGPVDSRRLAALLYQGQIDGATPVSTGDGAWAPVSQVPAFLLHVKKAEAGLRVEREVTGQRQLRRRKGRVRAVALALAALLLIGGAVTIAYLLANRRLDRNPLLEDFGAGIRLASAARVGVSTRAPADDEIEVPLDAPSAPAPGSSARPPARRVPSTGAPGTAASPSARASAEGGDLVVTQFDERKIQAVVAREQRTLAPCFRAEAARAPDFQGDIPIEFAIGNDGRVAQLWIDLPQLRTGPLRDCLMGALAGWRFEPFPGQRPTVSLAFRVGR